MQTFIAVLLAFCATARAQMDQIGQMCPKEMKAIANDRANIRCLDSFNYYTAVPACSVDDCSKAFVATLTDACKAVPQMIDLLACAAQVYVANNCIWPGDKPYAEERIFGGTAKGDVGGNPAVSTPVPTQPLDSTRVVKPAADSPILTKGVPEPAI